MDKIVEQTNAQLMMIEKIYNLKIINRDEVAVLIASNVDNNRQVLAICSSLNSWILLNKKKGTWSSRRMYYRDFSKLSDGRGTCTIKAIYQIYQD